MAATRPTLYTTARSANGRKPLVVSRHLGLDPERLLVVEVDVYRGEGRSPEYLAINPWGKIPTLVDGDLTLWESNAIAQYLSEAYGDWRLSARDPRVRADIARWLFWEASRWQPALVPLLTDHVGLLLRGRIEEAEAVEVAWSDPGFRTLASFLDRHLTKRETLVGDELTLADVCVGAMLMYVRRTRFPFAELPALAAWYERLASIEAWQATAIAPFEG